MPACSPLTRWISSALMKGDLSLERPGNRISAVDETRQDQFYALNCQQSAYSMIDDEPDWASTLKNASSLGAIRTTSPYCLKTSSIAQG